jgi:hypothetical protein
MSKIKSTVLKTVNGVKELSIDLDNTYDKYKVEVKDFSKEAIAKLKELNLKDALNDINGVCIEYEKQIKVIDNVVDLVVKIKSKTIP